MRKNYKLDAIKSFCSSWLVLLVVSLSGCRGCPRFDDWFSPEKEVTAPAARAAKPRATQAIGVQNEVPATGSSGQQTQVGVPRFAIVLLHGLLGSSDGVDEMAAYFRHKFGGAACVLQPTSREKWDSVNLSIEAQTDRVAEEVKVALAKRDLSPDFPIIPVGYSQGGLVACRLVASGKLNSVAFATVNAPLMGTPFGTVIEGIKAAQQVLHFTARQKTKGRIELVQLLGALDAAGVRDLNPESPTVRATQLFLEDRNRVPGLLVSSFVNKPAEKLGIANVSELLEHAEEFFLGPREGTREACGNPFDAWFAKLLTGKEWAPHDALLSLHTQLGQAQTFDLRGVVETASNQGVVAIDDLFPNVQARICSDVAHAVYGFNALTFNLGIETALDSRRVFEGLGSFVEEQGSKLGATKR